VKKKNPIVVRAMRILGKRKSAKKAAASRRNGKLHKKKNYEPKN